jgi:uncharacterized protein
MNESTTQLKDTTANPAPLGLLGFGMTTVLLNLHNAGLYELNSMILAMGSATGARRKLWRGLWNGEKATLSPRLRFFRTACSGSRSWR